ncbi:MAG: GatB/YqeY domain-containing protein [Candidatus Omnitrophica bacterium]|jgi:hypothetical protein|nr:GatB/YqeY domain-containing protein [Candidatus Omnitrophota bacterium]
MSLYEKLKADIVTAMKEKQPEILTALRTLDASAKNVAIQVGKKIPNDEEVLTAVTKAVKQGIDSADQFAKGLREDLAKTELFQVNLFKKYLPTQLTVEQLTTEIKQAIVDVGAKTQADFGKVMKVIVPKLKGLADGKEIQRILKELLG